MTSTGAPPNRKRAAARRRRPRPEQPSQSPAPPAVAPDLPLSPEQYRELVENLNDVVFIVAQDGTITYVSPVIRTVSGYEPSDVMGRPFSDFIHPDDLPEIAASFSRVLAGQLEPSEYRLRTRSGECRWVRSHSRPISSGGQVVGIQGVLNDITERVENERRVRQLNEELEQRVRERTAELEAACSELESFSYAVAHDLRAPLRAINAFSQFLLDDYGSRLPGTAHEYLNRLRAAALRMAELIDDLLQLSRITRSPMHRKPVNLSAVARAIVDELQAAEPNRNVTVTIADSLVGYGDGPLLRVLLHNLLANAWKFSRQRPNARIEVGQAQAGNGPVFFVRDNGTGFDMAYADKLFRPFQRLHDAREFEGTGVGLAIVGRIIQRHGGQVWAEGAVDHGATFFFSLPAAEMNAE